MKSYLKIFVFSLVNLYLVFLAFFNPVIFSNFLVFANQELTQINNEINQTKKKQQEILSEIKKLELNIKKINSTQSNLQNKLTNLKTQKELLTKKINELDMQIKKQDEAIAIFEKNLEQRKNQIKIKMNYIYKLSFLEYQSGTIWVSDVDFASTIIDKSQKIFLIENYKNEIKEYIDQIKYLNSVRLENENNKQLSQKAINDLEAQMVIIQKQINDNSGMLSRMNQTYTELQLKADAIQTQLVGLTQRQRELLQAELAKMRLNSQANQKPLQKGEFYFMGRGRDLVEGHGLGMSQWGAFGMAQLGWTYDRILNFYYPNTIIGDYEEPEKIFLEDCPNCVHLFPEAARERGYLTIDEYLAGLGEVPNNWPPEAIKAQIVAARTYLMGVCGGRKECTICRSDRCQVYLGGLGKLQWVLETKQKVILYNNNPIIAFYSASHRGCSSKLSDVWGVSDLPYIQNVRDDEFAFKGYYTQNPYNKSEIIYPYNWIWRTNGYSLNTLSEIFNSDPRLAVGNLIDIQLQKDVCGRVSRITIIGDRKTITLTGWFFRTIFNSITPYNDYLYSTEFGFYKNE